jgi:hypothetical protein
VGVHTVGGAEIDHTGHRLVRKQSGRCLHGRWVAANAARCESACRA